MGNTIKLTRAVEVDGFRTVMHCIWWGRDEEGWYIINKDTGKSIKHVMPKGFSQLSEGWVVEANGHTYRLVGKDV